MLDKLLAAPKKAFAQFKKLPQTQQLVIVAVLVLAGLWLYKNYSAKKESFDQAAGARGAPVRGAGGKLVCTMYYTEWCPHCTSAKPEWEKLRQTMDGKFVGGTEIMIVKVDCEKEKDKAQAAGVEGFPTFKFDLNENSLTYSGKERTFSAFKEYIESLVQ